MAEEGEKVYDCLVVGGGIAGLSSAYQLAKAGKKVALLDSEKLRSSASFNSTAITSHDFDPDWRAVIALFGIEGARELWALSDKSFSLLTGFAKETMPHFLARRLPAYIYSTSADYDERLHEQFELYRSLGAPVEFMEDASTLYPRFRKAFSASAEGESNNQAILRSLAREVRRLGGDIVTGTPVLSVSAVGEGVEVVAKSGKIFRAHKAILATGANTLLPDSLPVATRRTFVVQFEKKGMPALFKNSVLWDMEEPSYHYLRSFRGKFIWIGGEDVAESEYDASIDHYAPLEKYARETLGWDDSYKRVGEWSGTFYPTTLGVPYIGQIQDSPIYVNFGFGDTGVLMTFLSGYLLASWMEGREEQYQKYFSPQRPQ